MKAAGMEFVEVGLRDVVALTDAEFETLLARSAALKLPVRAAINFLPTDMKVVGPQIDVAAQRGTWPVPSPGPGAWGLQDGGVRQRQVRRFPEGFAPDQRSDSWSSSGAGGRQAEKHNIVIAIEPLGPTRPTPSRRGDGDAPGEGGRPSQLPDGRGLLPPHPWPRAPVVSAGRPANTARHVRIANPAGRAFPWTRPNPTTPASLAT
jgi:hypothetical protein